MLNQAVINKINSHYDSVVADDFEPVGVFLQGSQNYKCDVYSSIYNSDVDSKAIILPSFKQFVIGSALYSSTKKLESGQIDIKDIRVMWEMFKKQNISFVEILFTKYYKVNEKYADLWWYVVDLREKIARLSPVLFLKSTLGQTLQKYKALEHPYPTLIDKINKYGYDPKQLHHIVRLNEVVKRYLAGEAYCDILIPRDVEYLLSLKLAPISLEEARKLALENVTDTQRLVNEYCDTHKTVDFDTETWKRLTDIKVEFLARELKEEVNNY